MLETVVFIEEFVVADKVLVACIVRRVNTDHPYFGLNVLITKHIDFGRPLVNNIKAVIEYEKIDHIPVRFNVSHSGKIEQIFNDSTHAQGAFVASLEITLAMLIKNFSA